MLGRGGVREHQCLYVKGGRVVVVKGVKGGKGGRDVLGLSLSSLLLSSPVSSSCMGDDVGGREGGLFRSSILKVIISVWDFKSG